MGDFQVMNATQAKTNFGTLLNNSQRSPVMIRKNKKDISVMISIRDLEDMLLGARAMQAKEEGMVSVEETKKVLNRFRTC